MNIIYTAYQYLGLYIIIFPLTLVVIWNICYWKNYTHLVSSKGRIVKNSALKNSFKVLFDLSVIIGFIFGIHADILSGYDKNKSNSQQNYNWLFSQDVYRYPIDQIKLKDTATSRKLLTTINYSNSNKVKSVENRYVYVLYDKTGSADMSPDFKKNSENITAGFLKYLNEGRASSSELKISDSLSLNDYIFLALLKKLYKQKQANANQILNVSANCYLGGRKILDFESTLGFEIIENIGNKEIVQEINNKTKQLKSYIPSEKDTTDFSFLLAQIESEIAAVEYLHPSSFEIVIISDFLHEKDLNTLEYNMKSFCKSNISRIHQISLLEYPYKKNENYSRTTQNIFSSQTTKDLFTSYFDNIYHYPINTTKYLQDKNGYNTILSCLNYTKDLDIQNSETQYAYFYKPAANNTTLTSAFCNLLIVAEDTYNVTLRSNYSKHEETPYIKISNSDEILYLNEPSPVSFSKNQPYKELKAFNFQPGKDYFIEISSTTKLQSEQIRVPVVFREVLPLISSKILVATYTLWFVMLSISSILFVTLLIKYITNNKWDNFLRIFYCLFIVFKIILVLITLSPAISLFSWWWLLLLTSTLAFIYTLFFKYLYTITR